MQIKLKEIEENEWYEDIDGNHFHKKCGDEKIGHYIIKEE
jgi:hypothetical protein